MDQEGHTGRQDFVVIVFKGKEGGQNLSLENINTADWTGSALYPMLRVLDKLKLYVYFMIISCISFVLGNTSTARGTVSEVHITRPLPWDNLNSKANKQLFIRVWNQIYSSSITRLSIFSLTSPIKKNKGRNCAVDFLKNSRK